MTVEGRGETSLSICSDLGAMEGIMEKRVNPERLAAGGDRRGGATRTTLKIRACLPETDD